MLTILDACLVNGYTGHTAAGWTKPFANSGNIGCYKQGAGSGFSLLINDDGSTGTAEEFTGTGWQSLSAITGVGVGVGQFPTPAQLLTAGCVAVRKSATASSVARPWIIFADASTFYLFIASGDVANTYMDFMFGDIFSFFGSADTCRCMIVGRSVGNNGAQSLADGGLDFMSVPAIANKSPGAFIAGSTTGLQTSLLAYIGGNGGLAQATGEQSLSGIIPGANSYDGSYIVSPLYVLEATGNVRGYYRGLYHFCHEQAAITDGQSFFGVSDFCGKSFTLLKFAANGGVYCIETSPTVGTN
jgi:hypothetical protein